MPFVTDRTTIEIDDECGMRRWWFRHAEGNGIVPAATPAALAEGSMIHELLAASLLGSVSLPAPPDPDAEQEKWEQWAWLVGMTVAFRDVIIPEWITPHYTVEAVEQEMVLDRGDLWLAFTADAVLRQIADPKKLVILDYKSVSRVTKQWAESWPFSIQMHLNQLGVEEEFQEPVSHALVIGLDKGYTAEGKRRHPYIWAWSDGASGWSKDYKKGWNLRPVWEFDSDPTEAVTRWVALLDRDVALNQFPVSLPIVLDRQVAEDVLADRTAREAAVQGYFEVLDRDPDAAPALHRQLFPQLRTKCRKAFGYPCPYVEACWNPEIGSDPLASGIYVRRTPHHEVHDDC